jgi:orotidine-5'-phosphate decarboxylase
MTFAQRTQNALTRSCICVGLDPDVERLPSSIDQTPSGILRFLESVVDATHDLVSAFKPNFAFYESLGVEGWRVLRDTIRFIRDKSPTAVIIADAKRGDIGNTAQHYARAVFDELDADAVTVHPYMGGDSVLPFTSRPDKGAFILALTSNPGSSDFQKKIVEGKPLFETVIDSAVSWNHHGNIGLVVGATHPDEMRRARKRAGDMPFLIPGVGAQGGDLESAIRENHKGSAILAWINVSRSVLYAGSGSDFAEKSREAVFNLRAQIDAQLSE